MGDPSTAVFDQVTLSLDGNVTQYTRAEFLQIPLRKRVRYLLAEALHFSCDGVTVPARVALKSLVAGD